MPAAAETVPDLECVHDLQRAEALLHPLRMRILELAREPASATEMAGRLRMPRQRVNYHVRRLAERGLLRRAGRQRKRNMVEQRYVATARSFLLVPEVLGPLEADWRHVEDAARRRPVVYDKGGDAHYDFISAFIKAIRGSDPDAALHYLAAMLEGGEDARYIARRLIVHASEDIGMADSHALLVAVAAAHAVEHVGLPEARLNLAHATIYLARAPKSNSVITAIGAATRDVSEHGALRPPKPLRDAHYRGAKKLGHGEGYVYPPNDPSGYEVDNLPDELKGTTYYEPSGSGEDTG